MKSVPGLWKYYINPLVQGQIIFENLLAPSKTYLSDKGTIKLVSSKTYEFIKKLNISCAFMLAFEHQNVEEQMLETLDVTIKTS